MYWEALKLPGAPANAGVEEAAKWLQWAIFGGTSADKAPVVRYNLDQFWKAKAAAYPVQSALGREQLEQLDVLAHGVWSALETGAIFQQGPNFGAWLVNSVFGTKWGTSDRDETAARLDAANAGAVAAAARVGTSWGQSMGQGVAKFKGGDYYAGVASSIDSGAKPGGVPLWVWIAGGAVVIGALFLSRGDR